MDIGERRDDRWTLHEEAGRGGMGTVYRATDEATGQVVAVKVLHGRSDMDIARFDREAELLSDLRHPAIVSYLHHGVSGDGDRYIVMEWLEGATLTQHVKQNRLSVRAALQMARRAASALGYSHQRGVVHRDVKPSNLYLDGGAIDRLKLLDFGIARVGEGEGLTQTGMRLGTPSYM